MPAKDGTNRGGYHYGGRPRKSLTEKISNGQKATVVEFPEPEELLGEDMPPIKDFLTAQQKGGEDFCAEEVFRETYQWLKNRGCEKLVNIQLIEQYAMSVGRWIATENAISQFGYLARHPTTNAAIASPYVSMSQNYIKQANQLWFQIWQVVKENCSSDYQGTAAPTDMMEMLLRSRKGM